MTTRFVYHVSTRPGIRVFEPRRYWHNEDGTATGMLEDGQATPEGMSVSQGVFASDHPWPFFFAPSEARAMAVSARSEDLAYISPTSSFPGTGDTAYVFERRDEEAIQGYRFSIYTFDAQPFHRTQSGEYIAEVPVCPLEESVHENGVVAIRQEGISILFVADMERCYETLKENGVRPRFVRNVLGAYRDLQAGRWNSGQDSQKTVGDSGEEQPVDAA